MLGDKVGWRGTGGVRSTLGHKASPPQGGEGCWALVHLPSTILTPGLNLLPFSKEMQQALALWQVENSRKGLRGVTAMLSACQG